jgi:hypothetical protein
MISKRLLVKLKSLQRISEHSIPWATDSTSARQSAHDVACLLGTNLSNVSPMLREGILARKPLLADVQECASRSMLTAEVTWRFAEAGLSLHHRHVAGLLRSSGLEPTALHSSADGLVWDRSSVENAIADIADSASGRGAKRKLLEIWRSGTQVSRARISVPWAATQLGVPRVAFIALHRTGLVKLTGSGALLRSGRIERSSLEKLEANLQRALRCDNPPASAGSLLWTASFCGSPQGNPWPSLLSAILDGRLPAWRCKSSGQLSTAIAVDLQAINSLEMHVVPWISDGSNPILVGEDAAWLLGLRPEKLFGLQRDGLIARRPTLSQVQEFATDFVFTHEAAWRITGICGPRGCAAVPSLLRRNGIQPAAELTYRGVLIWPREQVDKFVRSEVPVNTGL